MALSERFMESEDLHPIDVAETLAEHQSWDFDRVADNQIAIAVEGQWRVYSVTVAWSDYDETLRLVCSFEMQPPQESMPSVYECLNEVNDKIWAGAFTYWPEQQLMVFRHGVQIEGGTGVGLAWFNDLIATAVRKAERFYPAFQLVSYAGKTPKEAMDVAIAEAYGHA